MKINILKKHSVNSLLLLLCVFSFAFSSADKGNIPDREFILSNLKSNVDLEAVKELNIPGKQEIAMNALLDSLKQRSAHRYYFNWKNFSQLLKAYDETYPGVFENQHKRSADIQVLLYAPETNWDLPSVNLLGNNVTAYELRHLARQQKSQDMTLMYFKEGKADYLEYWTRQVADLMDAYEKGEYEDAGNGVFEYYRAGRRIHNWLFNHHAYYTSNDYSKIDQEVLLKTFIYHGYDLAKRTQKYHPGNHHTKGLVGLFEIAVFLQDFDFSDVWIEQSLRLLTEHMRREINADGFQFERSVHYHVGDIENYFRVYQLAKINNIPIPELFEQRFKNMFSVLKKIAQPDKNLPVLQDDTDHFLKENNSLGGVFKAGALLLKDPELSYFASEHVSHDWFWLLARDLSEHKTEKKQPEFASLALDNTGYYIMRKGWDKNDAFMSISAGLDSVKPDHQHGDMLGLTAYAGGYQILPTYQVKYNKPDYYLFKNSWVKNVAIVDSIPHGLKYKGNTGGSGFGKFHSLPKPKTILWQTSDDLDIYVGTHDRYKDLGVETFRTVIFLKRSQQWIISDQFYSQKEHTYQQIWQGFDHADAEAGLHRTFKDDLEVNLSQIVTAEYAIDSTHLRDKRAWMVSTHADTFQFISRLETSLTSKKLDWDDNSLIKCKNEGKCVKISRKKYLVLGAKEISIGKNIYRGKQNMNLLLEKTRFKKYTITNISPFDLEINGQLIEPGTCFKQVK